jgi:hypothetical protein
VQRQTIVCHSLWPSPHRAVRGLGSGKRQYLFNEQPFDFSVLIKAATAIDPGQGDISDDGVIRLPPKDSTHINNFYRNQNQQPQERVQGQSDLLPF